MTEEIDIRKSIEPNSNQLNADDLLAGPITVTVTAVKHGPSAEQPVDIHLDGGHRPYRPCKSMRRVLVACWGDVASEWVGRRLTLYCDPSVKFGGVALGGIRISHLSDIKTPMTLMLTTTRSKRAGYEVQPLPDAPAVSPGAASLIADMETAVDMMALSEFGKQAAAFSSDTDKAALRAAYAAARKRVQESGQ